MTPTVSQAMDVSHQQGQFKQVVIAWEKLRLLYNVIMLLVGVIALFVFVNYYRESSTKVLLQVITFAIFTNLCFFAGPLCELYLRAFRDITNAQSLRWILFILGTVISLIPAGVMMLMPMLYSGVI